MNNNLKETIETIINNSNKDTDECIELINNYIERLEQHKKEVSNPSRNVPAINNSVSKRQ